MKKIFTSILLSIGFAAAVNAQCVPIVLAEAGLSPNPDTIPCYIRNVALDQAKSTIYFQNFDQVAGLTVEYLIIDSVTNLPTGVNYALNKPLGTQYQNSERGCINISGTPTSGCGQYRLGIYVQVKVTGLPVQKGEAGKLSKQFNAPDFGFVVRVREANENCPCIDTIPDNTSDSAGVAIPGRKACVSGAPHCPNLPPIVIGISEVNTAIADLAIMPNPMSSSATVTFTSDRAAVYTSRITNLLGSEVYSEKVAIKFGQNSINLNRNNLPSGIYFYSLSDGKGLVTKRFSVQ